MTLVTQKLQRSLLRKLALRQKVNNHPDSLVVTWFMNIDLEINLWPPTGEVFRLAKDFVNSSHVPFTLQFVMK